MRMSYFDEWVDDCFSLEDAGRIGAIGAWSYGSVWKREKSEIRKQLTEQGMADPQIEQFILGVFGETDYYYAGWVD